MKVKKLKEIFQEEEEGRIVLPNFQRDFVWKEEQQKELLATFLVELPISSILLLKGSSSDFNYRRLCYSNEVNCAKEECMYLLDGQQRMTTLKAIFVDLFTDGWEANYKNMWNKISYRWFLNVKSESENEDIFDYNTLKFNGRNLRDYTPEEVVDSIKGFKINKNMKNKSEWYHPKYHFKKDGNASKMNEFAELCSNERLIPLYGLYGLNESTFNKSLQWKTLEKIASKRGEEILAEIEDLKGKNISSYVERIRFYFDDIASEIDDDKILIDEFEQRKESLKSDLVSEWKSNMKTFLLDLLSQDISLIEIEKKEISRGIAIFESTNKGGTPLNNYDLIVAKASKNSKLESLTQRIKKIIEEGIVLPKFFPGDKWDGKNFGIIEAQEELNKRFKNQYLNLLSIFSHVKNLLDLKLEHIKREKIFEISTENINELTLKAVVALLRVLAFANYRLGITKLGELSYELSLLPMACIFVDDNNWNNEKVLNKVEYWYWTSMFIGRFREKQNVRAIEDTKTLYKWIVLKDMDDSKVKGLLEENNEKVLNICDYSDLDTLLSPAKTPSQISKSILGYVLSGEPHDLLPGKDKVKLKTYEITKNDIPLEEHHLIPLGTSVKYGELTSALRKDKNNILNSVLNKTLISKKANRKISDMGFEKYMTDIHDIGRIGQMIDSELKIRENENEDEYYKRILKGRFKIIRDCLLKELDKLKC